MAHYDVIIVGAGVAGCAMAQALGNSSRNLRVALVERSLAEPDRIVGELLQPGGVSALEKLGMADCLEGIDAIPVEGYCIVQPGEQVQIPYVSHHGRSFHHGKFIMSLRNKAKQAPGVEVIEAAVTSLVECDHTNRVIGVTTSANDVKSTLYSDLVIVADGCFSNFRSAVLSEKATKPETKSHFVGAVIKDAVLPHSKHGTVVFIPGQGPVLFYQIGTHDTRMLVDVKTPLPSDLKVCFTLAWV